MGTTLVVLLSLGLAAAGLVAMTPSASAAGPCIAGAPDCAVYVETRVCVTSPCNWLTVCVGFGLYCQDFTS
jgi:hypothetical protein